MTLACVSIIESSPAACIAAAARAQERGADVIELRLDFLTADCDDAAFALLRTSLRLPTIITLRPTGEGGRFDGDEADRLAILEQALAHGFDYIDLEYSLPKRDRATLCKRALAAGTTPILSSHNFTETPDAAAIARQLANAHKACADAIAKAAFMTQSYNDVLELFNAALRARKNGIRFALMSMGPFAYLSRVLAPAFGNELAYASLDTDSSAAPGQVDIATLRMLWSSLAVKGSAFRQTQE